MCHLVMWEVWVECAGQHYFLEAEGRAWIEYAIEDQYWCGYNFILFKKKTWQK